MTDPPVIRSKVVVSIYPEELTVTFSFEKVVLPEFKSNSTLLIAKLSPLKVHGWHVSFCVRAMIPPLNVQVLHLNEELMVNVTPADTLNTQFEVQAGVLFQVVLELIV
jgi:hypothetical protein